MILLLLSHVPLLHAWCCRACGKCMCSLYGVCPRPQVPQQPFHLPDLNTKEVAAFVASIRPDGHRNSCPAGCTLIELFNATEFEERAVTGKRLASLLLEHEARFTSAVVHNSTLRAAHCEWIAGQHLLPMGLKDEQYLALVVRLREALTQSNASLDRALGYKGFGGRRAQRRARHERAARTIR